MIDLRSDTVTLPTPAMREAMYRAEVGDDVYHEDPTINRLQEMAAERLGKEAALFVASGTMGNAAAVLAHAGRAEAVIVGNQSHIYHYEVGGASTLGGSPMVVVPTHPDGMLDLHEVQISISDGSDEHTAPTALLCIENTHNRCGGTVLHTPALSAWSVGLMLTFPVSYHVVDGMQVFYRCALAYARAARSRLFASTLGNCFIAYPLARISQKFCRQSYKHHI